ncbi:hypothetical protein [Paraburkholderia sp. A3RO-2L]|nr:hypothetical protein [Burkholderia vietnamiensis]
MAVRDAAADFHKLVRAAAVKGVSLDDEVFKAAEARLTAALHETGSAC